MPLPKVKKYTVDDIYALPEGKRAELIDGQIYYMAPPSRTHQRIVGKLFKYRFTGVREYWVVDPQKGRITVWDLEEENTREFSFSEPVKAGIYEDLVIDLSSLSL